MGKSQHSGGFPDNESIAMSKFNMHGDPKTIDELRDELPDEGKSWAEYILECVRLRKRVESRELVLTEPDTRPVADRDGVENA